LGFRSQLFIIPKKTGDRRLVLNLRPLNKFVAPQHFKMETLKSTCNMINHGYYFTSIDLADAFLHVLVAQCSHRYLQFSWEGQLYQFRVLLFGLSLSPLVFTKILKPVLKWARRKGIRLSAYLDDLLIAAKDRTTCQQTYKNGAQQTTKSWLHRKDGQVDTYAHTTNSTRRFHDRYIHNDLDSTNQHDTGLTTGSKSTTSVREVQYTPAFFIHREGTSINNDSVSGTFENTISHASKDPSLPHRPRLEITITLEDQPMKELRWWILRLQTWNSQSFLPACPTQEVYTTHRTRAGG
jgi:hypothetical protein